MTFLGSICFPGEISSSTVADLLPDAELDIDRFRFTRFKNQALNMNRTPGKLINLTQQINQIGGSMKRHRM